MADIRLFASNRPSIIHGATNFQNAVIQEYYPFGRHRCIRKMWIETAKKGTKTGQQRIVTSTTKDAFSTAYYEQLVSKDLTLFPFPQSIGAPPNIKPAVEDESLRALRARLNDELSFHKPKYSTYYKCIIPYTYVKGDGRVFVGYFHFGMYQNPVAFAAFRKMLCQNSAAINGFLDPAQHQQYHAALKESEVNHPRGWLDWNDSTQDEKDKMTDQYLSHLADKLEADIDS